MALPDKLFGLTLLIAAAIIFTYFTLWVIVTPFVDAKNDMQQYFPERKWAILIPTILLVGAISVAGTFIGSVMMKSGKRN